ncbi:glycoside hydrolase, partial [Coprobacter sp.]
MGIKKFLIFIALILPGYLSAQNYADYKLYTSYDFEQGANDSQSNTSMELKGARIIDDPVRGKVLYFDRVKSQYAVITPAPVIGDTVSLSFWYKRSSFDSDEGWKQVFEFYSSTNGSNIYLMPIYGYDDKSSGIVCGAQTFNTGVWETLYGTRIDADNTWHHVALVVAGTSWNYYLDGKRVASKKIFASLSLLDMTHLYFGVNPNRSPHPTTGSVDDIKIYHYPLSASQIAQIYAGEVITEALPEGPITFLFDNNLKEEGGRIAIEGSKYSFVQDSQRGQAVKMEAGGQLKFLDNIIPEGASTINFLYKKESIDDVDQGKYIYQASKDENNSYGLKIKVDGDAAYLVLETIVEGVKTETVGSELLKPGEWNAISMVHAITPRIIIRVYQNGKQTAAKTAVKPYSLGLDKWSLGSIVASQSADGFYDEFMIEDYAMDIEDIAYYYSSMLMSPVEITVDYSDKYQTIRNFGSSDAWDADLLGRYWPEAKKNRLAELLFSKELDENGNPKGIGLSCWRFNIGSGSATQGDDAGMGDSKRTECFLNPDGTYTWERQTGQLWFLRKAALEYGVEDILGFMNSPPIYMTKHGYAYNKDNGSNYILAEDKYDDYATFTAEVVDHFDKEGIHFDYISPMNEPQYTWAGGQEGSPATDQEIANVIKAMSRAFAAKQLTTQLTFAEAGFLGSAESQVPKFWGNEQPAMKVAGLPNVSNIVSAHSYWADNSAEGMYNTRVNFRKAMDAINPSLEYFQSEYSLLDGGYSWGHPGGSVGSFREIECAMALARMLHVDLVVANATGWHWWTTFAPTNHLGESRFALIEAQTTKDLKDGFFSDTKLLYTLGQYSRFVRPGMKRVEVKRSDNLSVVEALKNDMYSAYINEETKQVVIVAINTRTIKKAFKFAVENLPVGTGLEFTPYVTSEDDNMKAYPEVKAGELFTMPPLSVVTFVSEPVDVSSIKKETEDVNFKVHPNPVTDDATISCRDFIRNVMLYDVYGKR